MPNRYRKTHTSQLEDEQTFRRTIERIQWLRAQHKARERRAENKTTQAFAAARSRKVSVTLANVNLPKADDSND